jgi:hypothetical protein
MSDRRPDLEMPLLAAAYRELQGPGSDACPPAEALAALAVGERGPDSESVADHVVSCRRCADDMQVLLRTRAEMSGGRPESARVRPWLFAAAAAALVLGFLFVRRPAAPISKTLGVERGLAEEGARVTPPSGSELASAPAQFEWPPRPGAAGYRVQLFDASGAEVWRSERLTVPRVELPPPERDKIRAGGAYFWRVEVDGSPEKMFLGPFTFQLAVH